MPVRVRGNPDKQYFLSREDAEKILRACPDVQWRLIVALSRFAGLRCPSEHLALRWCDVDWKNGCFIVHSKKTKRHPGKAKRVVPIFPDLYPYLREAFEKAMDDDVYAITRYRDSTTNLRTQFQRIVKRARLEPWPKLFHNLRSTCQTELARVMPEHLVCAWIGNSKEVFQEHYLQINDDDVKAASYLHKVVQNPVQQIAAPTCKPMTGLQGQNSKSSGCSDLQNPAKACTHKHLQKVGDEGLEPATSSM